MMVIASQLYEGRRSQVKAWSLCDLLVSEDDFHYLYDNQQQVAELIDLNNEEAFKGIGPHWVKLILRTDDATLDNLLTSAFNYQGSVWTILSKAKDANDANNSTLKVTYVTGPVNAKWQNIREHIEQEQAPLQDSTAAYFWKTYDGEGPWKEMEGTDEMGLVALVAKFNAEGLSASLPV
eukprot:GHVU01199060.1.p1 GENE.GHVU01199060.1~~GHVU01199060.1.p1  ORF type:complete len:179 (+),score=32.89 GHVU01199060.1:650-1186(+)